jgi:hypothetical protein
MPLPADLKTEGHLETSMIPIVHARVQHRLGVSGPVLLGNMIVHHGHPVYAWTKPIRRVTVFGRKMTGDILIRLLHFGQKAFIELKLAKCLAPPSLPRALGQSLFLRLKHDYVICLVAYRGRPLWRGATTEQLISTLWNRFKIALVVRSVKA